MPAFSAQSCFVGPAQRATSCVRIASATTLRLAFALHPLLPAVADRARRHRVSFRSSQAVTFTRHALHGPHNRGLKRLQPKTPARFVLFAQQMVALPVWATPFVAAVIAAALAKLLIWALADSAGGEELPRYPRKRTVKEPAPPRNASGTWTLKTCTGASPFGEVFTTLNGHIGRQLWVFEPNAIPSAVENKALAEAQQSYEANKHNKRHSGDIPYRLQCLRGKPPSAKVAATRNTKGDDAGVLTRALEKALSFYETLQMEDGHWPADYGGPMFLLPGLIIACYVTEVELPEPHRYEMLRYLRNHQNADGGSGLHIEGHSTMFGTTLNYVAARLLGMAPDDAYAVAARAFMHKLGGAVNNTSWAKFWLALLGVYEWHGLNPLPPEMWLLPYWLLVHPGRFWCHCRMVYLPMSYLYGRRATCPLTPLTAALRTELYPMAYDEIDWPAQRNNCGAADLYVKHHWAQDALWTAVYHAEALIPRWLRARALSWTMEMITHEDASTRHVCIGPVNKAINLVACFYDAPDGAGFKEHLPRIFDYLWLAEDGMKMQGYNGSQLWDTAFAAQAIVASGMADRFEPMLRNVYSYIDKTQVRDDPPSKDRFYRHLSKGGWPFSTQDHGWPISDCTSEGLKAALDIEKLSLCDVHSIEPRRRRDAVDVILSFQNKRAHWGTGGWATYENRRGPAALELLNPSECFGDIVVDYDYPELTSACITALRAFTKVDGEYKRDVIAKAVADGARWIRKAQRADGSWYGSWGVCFTYGTWFGLVGLAAVGEHEGTSDHVARALAFLYSKQRADGGWGESYLSSSMKVYSEADESQVVHTAWAMLGILAGTEGDAVSQERARATLQRCLSIHTTASASPRAYASVLTQTLRGGKKPKLLESPTLFTNETAKARPALERAASFLLSAQMDDGDFPQQLICGVFNHNCMITYANYRNIFPIWALGEYRRRYLV